MAWGRRRKGKQGSGRNTPVTTSKDEEGDKPANEEADEASTKETKASESDSKETSDKEHEEEGKEEDEKKSSTDEPMKETQPTDEQEKGNAESSSSGSGAAPSTPSMADEALVLTSEKRRGIYECDYCHSDISQLPRIRCAICPDFDLCLDCFATTDHQAAVARLKAAATAHSELKADGIASTLVPGLSSVAANHDDTHGYKVCDSTRYAVFGSSRFVKAVGNSNGNNDKSSTQDDSQSSADSMDVDETKEEDSEKTPSEKPEFMMVSDDPKMIWTAEEDLRLLDAIGTHGLGNWTEISDAIGGNGSVGKTPKRCMERYFDDFLGRYGHILPPYTLVEDNKAEDVENTGDPAPAATAALMEELEEDSIRASKRRSAQLSRLPSNLSTSSAVSSRSRKRYKVLTTDNLPDYDKVWPKPYLPPIPGIKVGQEVARDLSTKNEQAFVKATLAAPSKEEADKIRKEWIETKMNEIGAPTVLPPRPEDGVTLPGAELVGFMPRRGEFDIEHENDAEQAIADMEFTTADSEQDKQLKVQVLQIYYQKQEEREKRKKFILSRNLYDYRQYVKDEHQLPQDERDLKHRLRLFERFHTPEEHKTFIDDIIKAKRLRKEIAKLQMYRRIGIRSLAEAEKFELDFSRRQFHKVAQLQKEAEVKAAASAAAIGASTSATTPAKAPGSTATTPGAATSSPNSTTTPGADTQESLWKQYRPSDRKSRRSLARTGSSEMPGEEKAAMVPPSSEPQEKESAAVEAKAPEADSQKKEPVGEKETQASETKPSDEAPSTEDAMDVDSSPAKDTETSKPSQEAPEDASNEDGDEDSFDISTSRGYDLLSRKERDLCLRLQIYPIQYLEIKKVLIQESLSRGLLDKEGPGSGRRTIVKMDIERRGNVVDFLLRAGWISSRLAKIARTVTPPPATEQS